MRLFLITILFTISCNNKICSQKKNGEVIYKVNFDTNLFNEKHKSRKMEEIRRRLISETKEITGVLKFSSSESLYFLDENMSKTNENTINLSFVSGGGKRKYYFNSFNKENIIQDCELLGECFRIKKSPIEWKITQKTKIVNGQTCYLATMTEVVNDKNVNVFAWFNPQIPINYGPKNYNGLPGLIIELITGNTTFRVYKIKYKKEIEKLSKLKGRMVSEEEFNKLCKKSFPEELFKK